MWGKAILFIVLFVYVFFWLLRSCLEMSRVCSGKQRIVLAGFWDMRKLPGFLQEMSWNFQELPWNFRAKKFIGISKHRLEISNEFLGISKEFLGNSNRKFK